MRTIRLALANDTGSSLPEALVAVILSLIGLSGMVFAIHTFTATEKALASAGHTNTQLSIADTTFRSDAEWAVAVVGMTAQTVTFITPTADNGCKANTWTMTPSNNTSQPSPVSLTTKITATMASDRSSCTGKTTSTVVQTMLDDAGPQEQFTYTNIGGRQATFSNGTENLDGSATQPSTIDDSTWTSTSIGKVVLNGTLNASSASPLTVRVSQVLLQIPLNGQAPTGSVASS